MHQTVYSQVMLRCPTPEPTEAILYIVIIITNALQLILS